MPKHRVSIPYAMQTKCSVPSLLHCSFRVIGRRKAGYTAHLSTLQLRCSDTHKICFFILSPPPSHKKHAQCCRKPPSRCLQCTWQQQDTSPLRANGDGKGQAVCEACAGLSGTAAVNKIKASVLSSLPHPTNTHRIIQEDDMFWAFRDNVLHSP